MEDKKEYLAIGKYLPMSPSKVRPVANLVRGKDYTEALAILNAVPNKGARLIKKVMISAGENAKYLNKQLSDDSLVVSRMLVDDGPRYKKVWPRSHGRRDLLLRRTCHITVSVKEKVGE